MKMNNILDLLKNRLHSEKLISQPKISDEQILSFESEYGLVLPSDLVTYFKFINGSGGEYEENFFCFYSFEQFERIDKVYADWQGVPDYSTIASTLQNYETCFVVADYQCNLFCYAVELHREKVTGNRVYAICGGEYKVIANSFTEFVDLYLNNSSKLQF